MIVVLGGGPAGLAAATALVRAGRSVVVHEAGTYPRHRVCGEFLSPDATPALASIGLAGLADRLGAPRVVAARFTASRGGRRLADRTFALGAPARGVARFDLDDALVAHARREGVEVRERSRADVLPDGAEAVVVATGRLARAGDHARPDDAGDGAGVNWVGVKRHVRGIALPGVTEVHAVRGAYAGLVEVVCRGERIVNVCALARADAWERAGRDPDGLWRLLASESPDFAALWRKAVPVEGSEAAVAGFGFSSRGALVAGRALAVGDAAVLTSPFSGAGQSAALAMGVEAASCLASLPADAAARRWGRTLPGVLRRRLAVGSSLQRALLAPSAAAAVLRVVGAAGPAASWLYRATRGAW